MADEDVAWPSYVDFMSAFVFILLLFLFSAVLVVSGAIERQRAKTLVGSFIEGQPDIPWVAEETMARLTLPDTLRFAPESATLSDDAKSYLRTVGRGMANVEGINRIIVEGFADKLQFKNDPFGNWKLSAARAIAVIEFFYTCRDCGYDPEKIRAKLVLRGDGDASAQPLTGAELRLGRPQDRRVQILVDFMEADRK